jgi:hypothetical protein
MVLTQLKSRQTNQYETVYLLYDENTFLGVFTDSCFAERFWDKEYLPSKRQSTNKQSVRNYYIDGTEFKF